MHRTVRHLPEDVPARRLLAVAPTSTYDLTAIEKPHENWGPGSKNRPALTTPATADDAPLDLDKMIVYRKLNMVQVMLS